MMPSGTGSSIVTMTGKIKSEIEHSGSQDWRVRC
jgi:hypothetical protein